MPFVVGLFIQTSFLGSLSFFFIVLAVDLELGWSYLVVSLLVLFTGPSDQDCPRLPEPRDAGVQEPRPPRPDPPPLLVLGEGGRQLQPPIGQCHGHVTTLHQSQLTWARSSAAPPAAARGSAAHGDLRTPATFCREVKFIYHAYLLTDILNTVVPSAIRNRYF